VTTGASVDVEGVLLVLKVAFLVLLYLFIWRIVRTASRDLRLPQESFVLAPSPAGGGRRRELPRSRLIVLRSPALSAGDELELDSAPLSLGRGGENDVRLAGDDFASSRHARFEPRRDGIWLEDIGSTNGTYVNGERLDKPRRLAPGDVIRIGETDLRYER
jgi:pSer/pThr/pTyr-binding forkhead associated (FHA) protein